MARPPSSRGAPMGCDGRWTSIADRNLPPRLDGQLCEHSLDSPRGGSPVLGCLVHAGFHLFLVLCPFPLFFLTAKQSTDLVLMQMIEVRLFPLVYLARMRCSPIFPYLDVPHVLRLCASRKHYHSISHRGSFSPVHRSDVQ